MNVGTATIAAFLVVSFVFASESKSVSGCVGKSKSRYDILAEPNQSTHVVSVERFEVATDHHLALLNALVPELATLRHSFNQTLGLDWSDGVRHTRIVILDPDIYDEVAKQHAPASVGVGGFFGQSTGKSFNIAAAWPLRINIIHEAVHGVMSGAVGHTWGWFSEGVTTYVVNQLLLARPRIFGVSPLDLNPFIEECHNFPEDWNWTSWLMNQVRYRPSPSSFNTVVEFKLPERLDDDGSAAVQYAWAVALVEYLLQAESGRWRSLFRKYASLVVLRKAPLSPSQLLPVPERVVFESGFIQYLKERYSAGVLSAERCFPKDA